MTVQNFWLDQLLMASVSSTSSFWGGLSGSFSITNSGTQAIQGWSFQFVSKYNHFDFYNADESAVANNDGTYTITVRAAAAAAPLGAGASLALGFTVTSDSDQDVTLAETVLIAGGAANSGSTGTSTAGAGSATGTPSGTTSGTTSGSTAGASTSPTEGSIGGTTTGASQGSTTTASSGDLAVQIKLGSSWAGAYEGTITVLNGGSGAVPAGWSVSFTSRHALGSISDFSVQQQALADGSYRVSLAAPAWAAAQPLAAGASLSSYFQASANLSGQTVSDLFQFSTASSSAGGSTAGGSTAGSSSASGTATSGSGSGTSSTGSSDSDSTDPGSTGTGSTGPGTGTTDTGSSGSGTTPPLTTATITAVADNVGLVQGNLAPAAISDDSTPTFSGSLSAALSTGESLRIFNGSTLLGNASVNNTAKTWTFTPTALANNGSYSISARVADAAGNLGSPSASFAFSLDTNPAPSTPGSGGSGGSGNATKRVVGYFEEWGIYGRDFNVADVKAGQLTNLNYSFFGITPTQADRPYMAAELNVLPGDWVQPGYQGLNSNGAGGLGIHDPWAAYEKTFTQADQLVSRRFEKTEWQEIGDGRRQGYLTGGDFNVSANADGSWLVSAKPDSWEDSQGGLQRSFSKADWDGLSDQRQAYLVDHSSKFSWIDQWQGNFTPSGSNTAARVAAVDAHFNAGSGRSLTLRTDGDLYSDDSAWLGDNKAAWHKLYAGNLNQLRLLKELNPELNIGFAIGGWTLSGNFSTSLDDAAGREIFTESIIDHLEYYDFFSSVDFDWEYPGGGGLASNAVSNQDGNNLKLTLELLDQKLTALQARTGRDVEISIATAGGADKLANLNLQGIDPYVDFYNVMAYDFHGGWESTTGHQAAMTGDPGGYDVVTAIDQFRDAGIALDKVVLGAPAYTRAWGGVAAGSSVGYQQAGSASLAPGSYEKGNYDQKDMITGILDDRYSLVWDDTNKAAFAYNPTSQIWSSIETTATIAGKAAYVETAGLGGMMFWAISNDSSGQQSLIAAAHDLLSGAATYDQVAARAPGFDQVLGGDGRFSLADFTSLA
jgi:GH18 family chitinase